MGLGLGGEGDVIMTAEQNKDQDKKLGHPEDEHEIHR